jgi:hypothetical protein
VSVGKTTPEKAIPGVRGEGNVIVTAEELNDMLHGVDPPLSLDTLNFLCEILAQVTLSAGGADFDEQAAKVSKARRELIAAVEAATEGT